MEFAVIIKPL